MKKVMFLLLLPMMISHAQVGRTEVVGYTTYDWLFNGPVYTYCCPTSAGYGIHVYWLWSNVNSHTDRNIGYNFYDFYVRAWNWTEGVPALSFSWIPGGYDFDPFTGVAVISATNTLGPVVIRDGAPGLASFGDWCQGPSGYRAGPLAVTVNMAIHNAIFRSLTYDSLYYSRIQPWGTWSTPMSVCPPAPEPMFPCHNINSSKTSNKVIITWAEGEPVGNQTRGYYRLSNDGGFTWGVPVQIPFPPTFGDTPMQPSFHITGFFAMFDNNENLHIVTQVHPVIGSTKYYWPAEIWHYCPLNNPAWSRIFHWEAETVAGNVGYNAIAACRPSIVQNLTNNYLYVTWEAFDSLNIEPTTDILRADIWIAESPDNGLTWRNQTRITTPNITSKRFPCAGGVVADTFILTYLIDSIAGFENYTQGRATRNPIVCHRIPIRAVGTQEHSAHYAPNLMFDIYPNPTKTYFTIRLPQPADRSEIKIFDVNGKIVKSEELKGKNNRVSLNGIKNGVYFVKVGNEMLKEKLVVTK